jgi:hypothetical protein
MQTEDTICLRCKQEETSPVWKAEVIYHDFDETGQEFDPIVTDNYDIVGFEDHCHKCKREIEREEWNARMNAPQEDIGPLF